MIRIEVITIILCFIISFVVSAAKGRGNSIAKIVSFFFFNVFTDFPVSQKVPKTGVVFVAAALVGKEE